jgi:cytochrome c oxidase subunit 2
VPRPRRLVPPALVAACIALGGCDEGHHSVFDSRTSIADRVATLGWIMIAVAGLVFVLVLVLMVRAVVGRRPGESDRDETDRDESGRDESDRDETDRDGTRTAAPVTGDPWGPPERRFLLSSKGWILAGGIVLPAVVVLALSGLTVDTLDAGAGRGDLEIHVVGHQYWWEVDYPATAGAAAFQTANEIHIPVGRTTELRLDATDVIHDLWVPELGPKRDMTPGHTTSLIWRPRTTGTFRGQCAEYCGLQHANMAFRVVVDTSDDFARWLAAQAAPAASPPGDLEAKGRQAFLTLPCSSCHEIRGVNTLPQGVTLPDGSFITGPDLTHVASRPVLAAETIANRADELAQWISDSQLAKPGNRMPPIPISDDDLAALVAYLESLR